MRSVVATTTTDIGAQSLNWTVNTSQMCWMCNWCWAHKMKLMRMIVVGFRFQEFWSKTKPFHPADCQIKVVGKMELALKMVCLLCRCAFCVFWGHCTSTHGMKCEINTNYRYTHSCARVFGTAIPFSLAHSLSPHLPTVSSLFRNRALIVTCTSKSARFSLLPNADLCCDIERQNLTHNNLCSLLVCDPITAIERYADKLTKRNGEIKLIELNMP